MGRTSPAPVVALVATALLLAGCGGSLADTDAPMPPRPDRTRPGDFCGAVLAGTRAAQPLAALLTRGGTVPPDQLTTAAEAVRSAYAEVLATAPGEIRADVERSVAAVGLQLDALEAANGDTAAVVGDAELRSRLTAPEYVQATEQVRDYIGKHCGIETRGPG
ncbi:MAG: hypothetical protein JNM77_14020 [Pseudonocardia sp.]|nr:hypothetical protein [Pseudonocardia sp.]